MWTNKYTTVNDAILLAQEEMSDDWGGENPVFETWAKIAVEKINGKKSFDDKVEIVSSKNNVLSLCSDIVAINLILQGEHKDVCMKYINNDVLPINIPKFIPGDSEFGNGFLFIGHEHNDFCQQQNRWILRDGNIIFEKDLDHKKFTVWSKSHNRDKDGQLMIKQTDVPAVAVYIMLNAARRSRWGKKETRLTMQDIRDYEYRWVAEMGNARAQQSNVK